MTAQSPKDFTCMIGMEAVAALNELGYPVSLNDESDRVILGLLVSLARQVAELQKKLEHQHD